MARYRFVTHWRMQATAEEVYDVLSEPLDLVRWWPSVYLCVQELEPGDKSGVGRVVALHTKGWLPYTLRWRFRVTETRRPHGFALQAFGDFQGEGRWSFTQDEKFVDIEYDWRISVTKPFLKHATILLRPFFSANHQWAMARGEESLRLELQRRGAGNDEMVPPPPGPTFPHNLTSGRYKARKIGRRGSSESSLKADRL